MRAEATLAAPADRPVVRGLPQRDRCQVMGILNVTPDSFSDGGAFFPGHRIDHGRAIAKGIQLAAEGADIVDVGGESTRPGARRVSAEEELHRVIPVVRALARTGLTVSVDTMRVRVAAAAVDAGAAIVNDVSGGLAGPAMAGIVAEAQVPYVLMHWRAHSSHMRDHARYENVATEVATELRGRLAALAEAGIDPSRVVLDPGLGFAKTAEHNWALLAELDALHALGRPILIGASRKSFLGQAIAACGDAPPPAARDAATAAVSAIAAAGAFCVRVHNVPSTVDAERVARCWRAARRPRPPGVSQADRAHYPEAGPRWP
ncbi:MAG: dihydropteroate synthase [Actinophytocola sp.]|nr:dihydropteroate synthase [Actinophytocola sp.]